MAGKAFIKAKTLVEYNPLDRLGVLTDFIDMMFGYRSNVDVVTSYNTAYASINTLWTGFARYAAWKQIINSQFNDDGCIRVIVYVVSEISAVATKYMCPKV